MFLYVQILKKYVYPLKDKEIVLRYSTQYDVDKFVIFSIIKIESNFKEKAKSDKNALGLMQLTEPTAKYISEKINLTEYNLLDKNDNINLGTAYFKYLLDQFNDINTSVIAYNAGEGNVKKWLLNKEYSLNNKTIYNIPFGETKDYLIKFTKTFKEYQKLYSDIVDK